MTNTAGGQPELTWKQFADSPSVRRLSRVAILALVPFITGSIGTVVLYFFSLDHRITTIELDRAQRIIANDTTTKALNSNVQAVQTDVASVKVDVASVKLDMATIKGILQEMQRSQNASYMLPRVIAAQPVMPAQ